MYQLYYSPGTCAMAVHVLMNELNLAVELHAVSLKNGETRTPEYLRLNPRGQVPLLVADDKPLVEGGAIMTWLCDKHGPTDLLPAKDWERAQALQWLMFANSTLHPAYSRLLWLNRVVKDEAEKASLIEITVSQIQTYWNQIEEALQNTPYLAGEQCTVGDILVTVIGNWAGMLPRPVTIGPKTKALLKAVSSRDAFQKALADEGVEYKAAA